MDLKRALYLWVKKEEISLQQFIEVTGYSYNHAYQMIYGQVAVTEQTLGRITMTYGADAAREILEIASQIIEAADGEGNHEQQG